MGDCGEEKVRRSLADEKVGRWRRGEGCEMAEKRRLGDEGEMKVGKWGRGVGWKMAEKRRLRRILIYNIR